MRSLLKISLAVSMVAGGVAEAGIVFMPGAGGAPTTATGFRAAAINYSPGVPLNNAGTSIAYGEKYNNNTWLGQRGLRWTFGATPAELGGLTNPNFQTQSQVFAINDAGQAVGYARKASANSDRAVRYSADSSVAVELGTLAASSNGSVDAEAWGINNAGVAVGYSETYQGNAFKGTRAVRWNANATAAQELGTLSVHSDGTAYAHASLINEGGTIAGGARRYGAANADLGFRPVRWAAGSATAFELDAVSVRADGYAYGGVHAINDSGVVAGYSRRYNGMNDLGNRPARWNTGGTAVTELGVLGTDVNGATEGYARSINAEGTTVGWVQKYSAAGLPLGLRAVRWDAGSPNAIELGGLGTSPTGASYDLASSINALGTISGSATAYTQAGVNLDNRAALWLPGSTQAFDLNTLLPQNSNWTLYQSYNVSDTGFVMGTAFYDPDGAGGAAAYQRMFTMLVPAAGTYGRGDANFDARVNFDDLLILAHNYGASNPSRNVNVGDFDLNGSVNFDDLLALAQHYGFSGGSGAAGVSGASGAIDRFAADWALARSMAPEPAFGLLGLLGIAIRRRRVD